MSVEGRVANAADRGPLAAMNQQLVRDEGHRNAMSLDQLEERMARWLQDEYEAVIFELDGRTVGYALFRDEPDWTYLRQFFILPEFRRQGVGRSAMQWLLANAFPATKRLRLDVLVDNQRGIAFWHAIGFEDYCMTMEMSLARHL